MKNKLKRLIKQLLGYFPSKLPTGKAEFEEWAQSFSDIYTLPTQDKDTIMFVLSSSIMHLGPVSAYKSKYYFYLVLNSGAAKQVAGSVFYDIKTRQQEAEKAITAAAKVKDVSSSQTSTQSVV